MSAININHNCRRACINRNLIYARGCKDPFLPTTCTWQILLSDLHVHMYVHINTTTNGSKTNYGYMYEGYLISLAILILGHCES